MPIGLETMIRAVYPAFEGAKAKVHLAQSNRREHPLDVYYEGTFDLWQATQNNKNFTREFVIASSKPSVPRSGSSPVSGGGKANRHG